MATHKTGTREQWLKVRVELLGDFSFDFNVSFTEEQQREGGLEYNYRREPPTSDVFRWRAGQECGGDSAEARLAAMSGTDVPAYHRDRPGMSAFALEGGVVHHTYSTYARGVDALWACTLARCARRPGSVRRGDHAPRP
jgi:predicted dithiol-disulfide oxidoreductase (DUF899 family)